MRNRRDRRDPNHLVLFVTNRITSGLPLLPRMFMNHLIAGCMARAQALYPVQLSHFLWMSNHFHLLVAGQTKFLSPFMCQMQTEIAKAVKKLFPFYQGGVWEGRFKEQRLCTYEDVLEKIVYIYTNPVKAGLVSRAEEWSGFSSLNMYKTGSHVLNTHWIGSKYLESLASKFPAGVNRMTESTLLKHFNAKPQKRYDLEIKPNVWKKCFEDSKNLSDEEIYQEIVSRIKAKEEEYFKKYNGKFMGMRKVKRQPVNLTYRPKKREKTPFIICRENKLRIKYIEDYREFCRKCKEAWKKWKKGDISAEYVYGAYRAGLPIIGRLYAGT